MRLPVRPNEQTQVDGCNNDNGELLRYLYSLLKMFSKNVVDYWHVWIAYIYKLLAHFSNFPCTSIRYFCITWYFSPLVYMSMLQSNCMKLWLSIVYLRVMLIIHLTLCTLISTHIQVHALGHPLIPFLSSYQLYFFAGVSNLLTVFVDCSPLVCSTWRWYDACWVMCWSSIHVTCPNRQSKPVLLGCLPTDST